MKLLFVFLSWLRFFSNVTSFNESESWGVVLADLRMTFSIRMHRLLRHLADVSPKRPVELHLGKGMNLPSDLDMLHPLLTIKYSSLPLDTGVCCSRTRHGYISKAYALLESSFETSFFFDSDVWFCPGWEDAIDLALASNRNASVLWAYENDKFGDSSQNNSRYSSPEIASQLSDYKEFTERNTGTVLGVRKSGTSNDFLRHVIEIWKVHNKNHISSTDQGSFREGAFIHRNKIQEAILSESDFCRADQKSYSLSSDGNCDCKRCKIVHYGQFFDYCSKNLSIPSENEYHLVSGDGYEGKLADMYQGK